MLDDYGIIENVVKCHTFEAANLLISQGQNTGGGIIVIGFEIEK